MTAAEPPLALPLIILFCHLYHFVSVSFVIFELLLRFHPLVLCTSSLVIYSHVLLLRCVHVRSETHWARAPRHS